MKNNNRALFSIGFAAITLLAAPSAAAQSVRNLPLMPPVAPPVLNIMNLRERERPMAITSYSVDAEVNGLFATVRTLIVFSNPNGRVLEGELEFPLPDGASVCGYALDVDGALRDGVVVGKDEARIAFEAEVKRGVDPGIVEHVRGNVWKTRIYPIPANGARTVRVEYVTPLAQSGEDVALRLPMPREHMSERSVRITVPIRANLPPPTLGGLGDRRFAQAEAVWRTSSVERDVTPEDDVMVAMPQLPMTFVAVERDRDEYWFAASVAAPPPPKKRTVTTAPAFRILWDASGSRRSADVEKALAAVDLLPKDTYYSLVVFRDAPEQERYFSSKAELMGALTNILYDGGTDLAALAATNRMLTTAKDVVTLLFTDGLDTLGTEGVGVTFRNTLALVSGAEKDMEGLRFACGGRVLDLTVASNEDVAREILHPSRFLERIEGDGIDLVQGVGQMAAGRVTVVGRLAADRAEVRFDFGGGVMSESVVIAKSDAKDGRTLAKARAAKRIVQLSPRADANVEELMALGREYGLASPKTSLIVLDTLEQYVRYGIEPPTNAKDLHEQWLAQRPDPATIKAREDAAQKSWMSSLKRDWDERVAWHKDPKPKPRAKSSGLFNSAREAVSASMNALRSGSRSERNVVARRSARVADMAMQAAGAAPEMEDGAVGVAQERAVSSNAAKPKSGGAKVKLTAWDPKTPYLQALKDCAAAHGGTNVPMDMIDRRYAELREANAAAPAFFLDCAGWFYGRGETMRARRILSNLAEMKLEDPALLRTFAWRLREAGDLDRAIATLRKVAKMRPEEPHSFRDLALVLGERARERKSAADATEAMELLKKTAFTPWKRQNARAVAVFAVEEFNALAAWCAAQTWKDGEGPKVPEWDDTFRHLLDVDLRIILSWDADNTDIDIHVLEPSGEEAYYQNRRTASGGFVSQDITTGYGPEEYLQKEGQKGVYKVLTHYYGSSQQRLTGPATATATVYTDWGRPTERRQLLSLRLDKPKEKVTVGEITFGTEPKRSEKPKPTAEKESAGDNGITAHRGDSAHHPQNSLAAFAAAIAIGADWIETDVRLTKDGEMVLSHDASVGTYCSTDLKIAESTFAQLAELDMAEKFRAKHGLTLEQCPKVRIVKLEEALDLILRERKARLSIQPKCDCVDKAIELVRRKGALKWVGFNDGSLKLMSRVKELEPTVPVFWDRHRNLDLAKDFVTARQCGFETLVLYCETATPENIRTIREAGFKAGVWTVNAPNELKRFLDMGVDRIYTDDPQALKDLKAAQ